jgi:hypothetical protein
MRASSGVPTAASQSARRILVSTSVGTKLAALA